MRAKYVLFCFIFSKLTTDQAFVKLKRNVTSLVIKKMQMKTTMRDHFIPSRMSKIKKKTQQILRFGKDREQLGNTHTTDGNQWNRWYNHFGKLANFNQTHVSLWPTNSTPEYVPKRTKCLCPLQNMYKTRMFTAVLAPNWKQPKYPFRWELPLCQTEYYSAK